MLCFFSLSLHRSAGFQDRQMRRLFRLHFHQRSHFKETLIKYELERGQTLKRSRKARDKLDELERREAFLQGRKEALLVEIRAALEELFASPPSMESFFDSPSPPRRSKIRRTETGGISVFQGNSGFLDSGKTLFPFLSLITLNSLVTFLNQIDNLVTAESIVGFIPPLSPH